MDPVAWVASVQAALVDHPSSEVLAWEDPLTLDHLVVAILDLLEEVVSVAPSRPALEVPSDLELVAR